MNINLGFKKKNFIDKITSYISMSLKEIIE